MKKTQLGLAVATLLVASAAGYWGAHRLSHRATNVVRAQWADHFAKLSEMVEGVELVAVGTVRAVQPGRIAYSDDGEDTLPYTNVTFVVQQVVKGGLSDRFLVLEQTGGLTSDGEVLSLDDGGPYEPGERYLLFLNRQPDSSYYFLVNPQGRFQIKAGRLLATVPRDAAAAALHRRSEAEAVQLIRGAGRNE